MGDQSDNIVSDIQSVERYPFFVPRPNPSAIPVPGIFDEPLVCLIINQKWAAHFRGVIDALDQPDTWIGTDEEIEAARQQIREALVRFGQDCMICCEDELALLQIMVDNQTTIINQNTQTLVTQYQQTFQNFVTNNSYTQNLNEQLYDGNPQSIFPEAGADFDSTGDGRLCAAIDTYVNAQIYMHGQEANNIQFAATAASTTFLAIGVLLSVISGGASLALGLAASVAIHAGVTIWENILNDAEAQRKVKCCMYDALNGTTLSEANFQTSVDGCGFDSGSNEANLAAQIASDNANYPENWLAFLRAMGNASDGSTDACLCGCDENAFLLVPVNDCTVTQDETDPFKWHIDQMNYVIEGVDPHRIFKASFTDLLSRCFNIVDTTGTAASGWRLISCDNVETEGVGGLGGEMIEGEIRFAEQVTTPYVGIHCVIELECPV